MLEHALISATQESSPHGEIAASTAGVVFLGTPHLGCKDAELSGMIIAISEPFETTEHRIIQGLKRDAETLHDRLHEFTRWINHQRVPIVCFYETIVTDFSQYYGIFKPILPGRKVLLVPAESACIVGHRRTKLDKTHSGLNKFFGASDPAYEHVFARIEEMAQGAAGLLSTRQNPRALPQLKDVRIEELRKCLQEMKVTDPRDILSEIQVQRGKRVGQTCDWILEQKEFCHWQTSETSMFLRFVGPPGIGKTILSTFIVEYIKKSVQISSGRAFAYFFCDDKAGEDRRMPAAILRSLIWQLLLQNNDLFQHLKTELDNRDSTQVLQNVFTLCRVLRKMVRDKGAGEVFILIDAFDECDKESRKELLAGIAKLFSKSLEESPAKVKFLVTCREAIPDLDASFRELGVTIEIHSNKVKGDLEEFIELKTQDLVRRNPGLKPSESRIKQELKAGSEGTFLWVSLMMAEIERSGALNHQVKKLLQSPLRQLGEVYESILNGILPAQKSTAQFILHCMVASKRPLTKMEMKIAFVTSQLPTKNIRNSLLPRQRDLKEYDDILSACSSILIPLHAEQGDSVKISFCHQSVKDFLLEASRTNREWYFTSLDHANLLLFQTCWKYLTAENCLLAECLRGTQDQPGLKYVPGWDGKKFPTNHRFIDWTTSAQEKRLEYMFLDYVYQMWAKHAVSTYPAVKNMEIVSNDAPWLRDVWFLCAARDGNVEMLKFLLPFDKDFVSRTDEFGRTAFSWAAGNGYTEIIKILFATGKADIESKDSPGRTPLSYAAGNGHVEIMEMLFATRKVDIESKARLAWRPLHWAARAGYLDAVKKLLDMGAEVDPKDAFNQTPLSMTRNSQVYDLLLRRGAAEIELAPPIAVSDSDAESLPENFAPLF
ncbi:unnamed protein product [Penicillium salamii]|uniref:Nephrocystin 3-like N-terminal domain-containing protein n=1 Tax=Penicillium salamii TaxID=1612424 RepID=A0A9W4I848_9EURO|nr:unnamed protein product [Penicillium salamii]